VMDDRAQRELRGWFTKHAANPRTEIEARIRNVTQIGFEAVMAHLKSNQLWTNSPEERETLDCIHVSGVRETIDSDNRHTFMRKNKIKDVIVQVSPDHPVRFAVAEEMPGSADESPVSQWRFKQRITFVHKGMFSFELTRVRAGTSEQAARSAPISHEIEIEFCGQSIKPMPNAQYLADSLVMKVRDVVSRLCKAADAPQQPAKRPRVAGSALSEGQQVLVSKGAAVALESAGHAVGAPFDGEMPAELAERVPWVLSHVEKDDAGSEHAYIMSLPCAIHTRSYPLFFFYGSVPVAAVVAKSQSSASS